MVPPVERTFTDTFENLSGVSNTKLWLVQKNRLLQQAKGKFASFFRGNCYIVIRTRKPEGKLRRDIYVWIGSGVDQDEEYKILKQTYELTKPLEGTTIYRQCEKNESRQFLDIFPYGIRYFNGTSASYLHFSGGNYVKRLFQVKGRRNIYVTEVPLSYTSMNVGDSFVLDDEWTIYCWNGKHSNKAERVKAIEIARVVRDDLCFGKAEIVIADDGVDIREERQFFDALESYGPIKSEEQGGIDDYEEYMQVKMSIQQMTRKLYRIIDDYGDFIIDPMTYTRLERNQLNTSTCYLMDTGEGGLYVWVGLRCTNNDTIINFVMRFIGHDDTHDNASVTIMREGLEVESFKQFFDEWPERNHSHTGWEVSREFVLFMYVHGALKELEEHLKEEENTQEEEEEKEMIDDAQGPIKIWQIDGFNKLLWPPTWYSYFFDNECYIVEYTSPETEQYVLYVWQGKESYEEEQLAALQFAQQMDRETNYQATVIRMVEGKEPDHFLFLFKGRRVVLLKEEAKFGNPKFLQIKGTDKYNMSATQLPLDSSSLQSDGAFVLLKDGKVYLWHGRDIGKEMKELSEDVADNMAPKGDFYIFTEGTEHPQFWEALGGKRERVQKEEKSPQEEETDQRVRLFHCSDDSGKMQVEEIYPFDQKDLNGDDVMILDVKSEVFIWFGNGANEDEKRTAYVTAQNFIKLSRRDPLETTINIEKQGLETPSFIAYFTDWNYEAVLDQVSYVQLKKQVKQENELKKNIDALKQRKTNQVCERIVKRTQYKGILKS